MLLRRLRSVSHRVFSTTFPLCASSSPRCVSEPSRLSYVFGASREPLLPHTIGNRLRLTASNVPERTALVCKSTGKRKTYAELMRDAEQLAATFAFLGLVPGDRIGLWASNCVEWVVTQYAAALAGMILVHIDPSYCLKELTFALRKVGVKLLVLSPEGYHGTLTQLLPTIDSAPTGIGAVDSPEFPDLKHVVVIGAESNLPGAWSFDDVFKEPTSVHKILAAQYERDLLFTDVASIHFTKGRTEDPKAVTLTHHAVVNNAHDVGRRLRLDVKRNEIICLPLLFYHSFGSVMGIMCSVDYGQTVVSPSPSFDASATLRAIQEEKATLLYGFPRMFNDLLHSPELSSTNVKSLHGGLITGAPCPAILCKRVIDRLNMKDFVVAYALTSLGPMCAMSYPSDSAEARSRSAGFVGAHWEISVRGTDFKLMPRGEKGEVVVRGYGTTKRYWNDEVATKKAVSPDRWFRTGDVGYMNKDGSVVITGRVKDIITRGGRRIFPSEIEEVIFQHPKVTEVHVVGVTDPKEGEAICAWVCVKADVVLSADEVKEHCQAHLAPDLVPQYVLVKSKNTLPLTATGKVQKFKLRELSRQELNEAR